MTPPFEAARADGRSLATVAYEHIVAAMESGDLRPGGIITHAELSGAMETETGPAYYQAVNVAIKRLQKDHGRSLRAVRGAGYRLIAGVAMVDKADAHHERGRKQIARARTVVDSIHDADVPEMSQKQLVRAVRSGFAFLAHVMESQADQLAAHEREIEALKNRRLDDRAATAEELAEVRRRLAKLEGGDA